MMKQASEQGVLTEKLNSLHWSWTGKKLYFDITSIEPGLTPLWFWSTEVEERSERWQSMHGHSVSENVLDNG